MTSAKADHYKRNYWPVETICRQGTASRAPENQGKAKARGTSFGMTI
jgi:hypothetical protein